MRILITIILISFSVISNAQTEYRKYAIKVVGIKVGEIIATKSISKDKIETYTLSSLVDVNFLVYHLKVDYKVKSMFKEQGMFFSEVDVKSNRGDFNTTTEKIKGGFQLKSKQPKKEIEKILNASIFNSFSKIHFHEPVGLNQIYAEFYGDFIKINYLGNHKYAGVIDNNVDEYYYENGFLIKAIKKNPITDMVIVFEKSWIV